MKKSLFITILLCYPLACSLSIKAQGFQVEGPKPPSLSDSSNPPSFNSLDGRFVISLPAQVSGFKGLAFKVPAGIVTGQAFQWQTAEGRFSVIYLDRPETFTAPNASSLFLDQIREQALTQVTAAKGKLIKESGIILATYPGRELKIELPQGTLTMRIYLVGSRLYQLTLAQPPDQQPREAIAVKALDSFRLLTPTEVEVAMKKNRDDATPTSLPQEPVAKRLKSDAQDEGLKGRVKVIASEDEDLSGTWSVSGRKPSSTYYYNEQGNWVKSELYDYRGNLMEITVYGYIDGDRASNYKSIRYEYDPPPAMAPPGASLRQQKRDPRYSSKYKYEYDDKGRLAEKQVYRNDGSLQMRYVYHFKDGEIEELVYSDDGSVNQRYLSTLNGKGIEVEKTDFDVQKGSVRSKYAYDYEFDSAGNWIKKTTRKWVTRDGKSFYEPAYVTYRNISYY